MYSADFTLNLGVANTALTLHAAIVGLDGNAVAHAMTGFTNLGRGVYMFHTAAIPNGQRGTIVFYTGTYSGIDGEAFINSGITIWAGGSLDAQLELASRLFSIAEPAAGEPPAEPILDQAIALLYAALVNDNRSTSASRTIVNSDGDDLCAADCSDDGTFRQGKLVAP